jgi:uncharacterized protein with HEPN domain
MMNGLRACPFSNILCTVCGQTFNPDPNDIDDKAGWVASSLSRHLRNKHGLISVSAKAVWSSIKSSIQSLCDYHAVLIIKNEQQQEEEFLKAFMELDNPA